MHMSLVDVSYLVGASIGAIFRFPTGYHSASKSHGRPVRFDTLRTMPQG